MDQAVSLSIHDQEFSPESHTDQEAHRLTPIQRVRALCPWGQNDQDLQLVARRRLSGAVSPPPTLHGSWRQLSPSQQNTVLPHTMRQLLYLTSSVCSLRVHDRCRQKAERAQRAVGRLLLVRHWTGLENLTLHCCMTASVQTVQMLDGKSPFNSYNCNQYVNTKWFKYDRD